MKKWRKTLLAMLALLMVCLAAGQCVTAQAAKNKTSKYKVTMNKSNYTLKKGKSVQLKATKNKAAKKKKVVWTSSNKKVATVSSKGKVKAKKKGKATITAKLKGTKVKASCKIVVGTPVSKVKLDKKTLELEEGGKAKLKVTVSPKKPTNKKVIYKTSKKSVVTVNSKGELKAVKKGKAKVTVTAADGTGKSAACTITVKAKKQNTPNPDILAESVTLSETNLNMLPGDTKKLSAAVKPDNTTNKAVTWKSSPAGVVTVSNDGTVKAVGEGTATVTAAAQNGKSASCSVKVAYKGTASNQTELNQALLSKMVSDIVYASNAAGKIEIPAGDYSNKTLEINAPNADVINHGKFKKVTVNAIAKNTYTENSANVVYFNAAKGRVVVGQSGSATINLSSSGNQEFALENHGYVQDLNVPGKNTVLNIEGSQFVNLTLGAGAANSSVITSTELRIAASVTWDMTILPGAEQTKARIDNHSCLPSIWGLGCIPVTITAENDVVNIPAEMKEGLGIDEKVSMSGNVNEYFLKDVEPENPDITPEVATRAGGGDSAQKEAANGASADARIYLLPYGKENSGLNDANYTQFIQGKEAAAVTDNDGMFTIENVVIGNYWMIVEKEGYKANVKNIVITSSYTGGYACGATVLLSHEIAACENAPTVSGTVKEGLTANPVSAGFQVKLRKGAGNILGGAFLATVTDADGNYQFTNVPAGVYTVEVLDLRQNLPTNAVRYNAANIDIVVAYPYLPTDGHNCVVDQQMETITGRGQVQFTLTWGNRESGASSDIDSHLVGPRADGNGEFHVYFNDKEYYANGKTMADLDVDDVDYEGPEHTTIYEETDGVYRFYIHNYSESGVTDSEMFGKSSIRVRVTIGTSSYIYNCPNVKGNLWYVCDYNSITHTIIPRNVVSNFLGDVEDIGLSEEELNAKYLEKKKASALDAAADAKKYLLRFTDNAAKADITASIAALEGQVDSASDIASVESILNELQQMKRSLYNAIRVPTVNADNLIESRFTIAEKYDDDYHLIQAIPTIRCGVLSGSTLVNGTVTINGEEAALNETSEEGYAYVIHAKDSETGLAYDVWVQVAEGQAQINLSSQAQECYDWMGLFETNETITSDKAIVDGIVENLNQITDMDSYEETMDRLFGIQDKYEELSNTFSINEVTAGAGMESWWESRESVYGENNEEIGACAVLRIERSYDVTDEDVLSKLSITFSDEAIKCKVTDSDIEGYSKLVKAESADGFVKKIYIRITEY